MIGRLLCRLGIHRWRTVCTVGPMIAPGSLDECRRCGEGRVWRLHFTQKVPPEQMRRAYDEGRIS